VRVHNDRGSFQAELAVDEATRPGVAFTYKAYWARLSPDRANVNAVTAVRDTDLGGGPTFHDTRVEVCACCDHEPTITIDAAVA
jgi:anaerobic selenocysteine-containing dehydrogenase